MDNKYFSSDNENVLAKAVSRAIRNDGSNPLKRNMRKGVDYYEHKHDILDYRLFYYDNEGIMKEEFNRANTKISHGFFTELVDQKVQYLLSNPVEIYTEDTKLKEHLKDYVNEEFQLTLQEVLEGASKKAFEYIYAYIAEDGKIKFSVAEAEKVIEVYDMNNVLTHIIRYYDVERFIDGKVKKIQRAELWDSEKTWYFISEEFGNFKKDDTVTTNPRPHLILKDEQTETLFGKGLGYIPFFRLDNNKVRKTDLEPIKSLIDDYDLMACSLSNNLIDFDHPIYAVRGYPGDKLDNLVTNLKTRKTIAVKDTGGIDVKTVDIPVEARKTKLKIDQDAIYKFGMGFDSTQVGDGNITNVVIKSRYSLLDLKCNKSEVRLRMLIKQLLELIINNINELHHTAYHVNDLEIIITRDTMVNEKDVIEQEKIKADTMQVLISNILDVASRLDDKTVLKELCEILELDFDAVQKALGEQDYTVNVEVSEADE